ncbi:MAG: type I polyketide synthase, partial [Deltaproteobacteria bacterium]|nr:type I polyketide synthase [Deltaproteobacteria bacterium]
GPIADAYKDLHVFPTTPPDGIRFYSCALGRTYDLTEDSTASSIRHQAISGFDFTALIKQAYEDGIRIFLEMGPRASCSGMINRILDAKPHLAVSACHRGEDGFLTLLKFLGDLIAERIPVDLDKLYGIDAFPVKADETIEEQTGMAAWVSIGGTPPRPVLPGTKAKKQKPEIRIKDTEDEKHTSAIPDKSAFVPHTEPRTGSIPPYTDIIEAMSKSIEATADAHKSFLDFSNDLTKSYEKTFALQTQLLEATISGEGHTDIPLHPYAAPDHPGKEGGTDQRKPDDTFGTLSPVSGAVTKPVFDRKMCMEFAVGSVEKVLGPDFAIVDTYKARVRLPDEPLMLVDRIVALYGEKGSMGSGRVVTEHDVHPDAWYLDGDRAPVCISVEAGQADLFLCAYLGIDLAVKGERTYRLLDAAVQFHSGLPRPGDVIRYEIEIDHFARQGDTYLFFFRFEGYVNGSHLISMTDGCAGFFTEEEVKNSGGIILTEKDMAPHPGKKPADWKNFVPVYVENFDDDAVDALRKGNLAACFGKHFAGIRLSNSLRLPGGRMRLIDRILLLDPVGGRFGLGIIRAEADIHPDDWFLTCHFMDDMVMPGTLMYECCAHTLRVFLQRMGWVIEKPGVCYEPVSDMFIMKWK